jgi:hypothetical protein
MRLIGQRPPLIRRDALLRFLSAAGAVMLKPEKRNPQDARCVSFNVIEI